MKTTITTADNATLAAETFGDAADAAILLIHGAAASMDYWEDEFCTRLAAAGRYVIRYDHRDTGESTSYEPGKPGYTGTDLLDDAATVIDALAGGRAHVVGLSAGGAMAQELAGRHPDKVTTLTLIATSPAVRGPHDLPPPSDELRASFAADAPQPDWSDREAVLDFLAADERLYAGSHPYDETARRAFLARVLDRTRNIAAAVGNHYAAEAGDAVAPQLSEIDKPTLVMHGSEDPLFPLPHGELLAREIPNARLVVLDKAGHELPEPTWDVAIAEIVAHTS